MRLPASVPSDGRLVTRYEAPSFSSFHPTAELRRLSRFFYSALDIERPSRQGAIQTVVPRPGLGHPAAAGDDDCFCADVLVHRHATESRSPLPCLRLRGPYALDRVFKWSLECVRGADDPCQPADEGCVPSRDSSRHLCGRCARRSGDGLYDAGCPDDLAPRRNHVDDCLGASRRGAARHLPGGYWPALFRTPGTLPRCRPRTSDRPAGVDVRHARAVSAWSGPPCAESAVVRPVPSNPMAGIVETFRRAVVLHQNPDAASLFASVGVVAIVLVSAYVYFKLSERTMADVI